MNEISKYEKEKILQLLECSEEELRSLTEKSIKILEQSNDTYDVLLKILQQGLNVREATLSGIILGKKLAYDIAKKEMEEEIKEKLFKAFKNSQ